MKLRLTPQIASICALVPALLASATSAGTAAQQPADTSRALVRPLLASPQARAEPALVAAPSPGSALRTAEVLPVALDDAVPLPVPAVRHAGPDGDRELSPRSGNPHYLGFAAGPHLPPAGEWLDPLLASRLASQPADARPADETYAFVMFSRRITEQRLSALASLGARPLGFHPWYAVKVALPPQAVEQVAALDFVRWVGVARPWQKLQPALAAALRDADAGQPLEVFVDVFESDLGPASVQRRSAAPTVVGAGGALAGGDAIALEHAWTTNGWMQAALEKAGVEVGAFDDRIDAFRARLLPAALAALVELDFVQFVELVPQAEFTHDESMPMINADFARNAYDGGTNSRSVVGHVDSGFQFSHQGLNHVAGVGWDLSGSGSGPWVDGCGHGSHTAGTILGDGAGILSLRGVAPGLGWGATGRVFVIKLSPNCTLPTPDVTTITDILDSAYTDGSGNVTPRPHATSNSWGSDPPAGGWIGSEDWARLYDNNAFSDAQLSVFSAGNAGSGSGTMGLPGAAKNVLTVGSVVDFNESGVGLPGTLANSSSRGPCGDGRWKPNVVAPGRYITSVDAFTAAGFTEKSGTSMAAPHVTGGVAALVDALSYFAYKPELVAAHLMATALRKSDQVLTYPTDAHLDEYGTGRIDLTRAIWQGSGTDFSDWTFSLGNSAANGDFVVPAGTTRLVVAMQYVEPAASAGASQALVNDWDLYIDMPPLDPAGNVGDYVVQQSSVDNTEIRVISNPTAGTWRWKVWPQSVTGSAYFGVCVYATTNDTTPAVSVTTSADDAFVQPGDPVQVTTTVSTLGGTASAVFLDSTSSGDTLSAAAANLKDGSVADLLDNMHSGRDIELGNVDPAYSRSAQWTTSWASEGVKSFSVSARGDNIATTTDAATVTVDGTQPAAVTNLHSTSHTLNVWSNDNTVDFAWTAATDNLSGIDGYGESYGSAPGVYVANAKDMEEVTSFTRTLPDGATRYWALKSVDYCGNWDADNAEVGPYKIDTVAPTGPGTITSTTHTPGVQSCVTLISINWTAASDALSGLAGYRGTWDSSSSTIPSGALNLAASATNQTINLGSSAAARYFHLRAQDNAGNWGTTQHFGPVYANANSVSTYCTAKTNSLGCLPAIGWSGQPDRSAGTFTVTCTNVLNQQNGLIFWGTGSSAVPFQGGWKCVANPIVRGPLVSSGGAASGSSCTGSYSHVFTTAYMNTWGIGVGDTIYAQFWMRDPPSASTTSLSNALKFTVCE